MIRFTPRLPYQRLVLLVWLVAIAAGYVLVSRYTQDEKTRALQQWEQNLATVASSQAGDIGQWLQARRDALTTVADNMSVRLYVMTLLDEDAQPESSEAAETFLRNYLIAVAGQVGALQPESELDDIRANVEVQSNTGLAIITADHRMLVHTRHFPVAQKDEVPLKDQFTLTGPVETGKTEPLLWFSTPVRGVQAGESDAPLGWVIGAIPAFPALDSRLEPEQGKDWASSWVIGTDSERPEIIAPRMLRNQLLSSLQFTPVMTRASEHAGVLVEGKNLEAQAAYAYGSPVAGTGWTVVRHVTREQALSEVEERILWLHLSYWAVVVAITFIVLALWRHVAAERLQLLLSNIRSHERLLEVVTNHMPARIFITDAKHRFCYANKQLQTELGMDEQDMRRKTLPQLFGPVESVPYIDANERALRRDQSETILREQGTAGMIESVTEVKHIPLADIPEKYTTGGSKGVLVIEHDLTEIIRIRQAKQATLNKLIETLVMLIDKRDPHAAHHSAGVAKVAGAVARTMSLGPTEIETVEIAGQLMNLGKLLVPQEVLTSAKPLGEDDRELIASSMKAAISYLAQVPFDGDVVETLRQSYERPDGKGPLGLGSEEILDTAAILAVANSFVAITSPRAWREGKPIDEAKQMLLKDAGTAYVRSVVTALCHYLENGGGTEEWQAFLAEEVISH